MILGARMWCRTGPENPAFKLDDDNGGMKTRWPGVIHFTRLRCPVLEKTRPFVGVTRNGRPSAGT